MKTLCCILALVVILHIPIEATASEGTCCTHTIYVAPIEMPPEEQYYGNISDWGPIEGEIVTALKAEHILDCPLRIEVVDRRHWLGPEDYEFIIHCDLTVENATTDPVYTTPGYPGYPLQLEGGSAHGDWTLTMYLSDGPHGNVLHSNQLQFTGSIFRGGVIERNWYTYRSTGIPYYVDSRPIIGFVQFLFLDGENYDNFLHKYESMPELCELEPEKDSIEAGKTMKITVKDLVDSYMSDVKPWQRLCVRAELGEITNGFKKDDEWSIFECGDGTVEIEYKAPDTCENNVIEQVEVYNSCDWTHGLDKTEPKTILSWAPFKVYDRRAEKCDIVFDQEQINPGDYAKLRIENILDNDGKKLDPDEKIAIKVNVGEILGAYDRGGYDIADVGLGDVEVRYHAPDDCTTDKVKVEVYNVCSVSETTGYHEPKDMFAEKKMPLFCPSVWARLEMEYTMTSHIDQVDEEGNQSQGDWEETWMLSVYMTFDKEPTDIGRDFDIVTQSFTNTDYSYTLAYANIASGSYVGSGTNHTLSHDNRNEITASSSESGTFTDLEIKSDHLWLVLDPSTQKVIRVTLPGFHALRVITGNRKCTKRYWSYKENRSVTENCSSSLDREIDYAFSITGEDDCYEVNSGDGKMSMRGGCTWENDQGAFREVRKYTWEIHRAQ